MTDCFAQPKAFLAYACNPGTRRIKITPSISKNWGADLEAAMISPGSAQKRECTCEWHSSLYCPGKNAEQGLQLGWTSLPAGELMSQYHVPSLCTQNMLHSDRHFHSSRVGWQ